MDRPGAKPKPRRKLSKSQIIDILERNVTLYKEEDTFVHYLVELAIYLMEYEYDWSESEAVPPALPGLEIGATSVQTPLPTTSSGKVVVTQICAKARSTKLKSCPYCGVEVGDQLICPACRNMTR